MRDPASSFEIAKSFDKKNWGHIKAIIIDAHALTMKGHALKEPYVKLYLSQVSYI